MLSVSGARGLVGLTMTPAIAADYAAAFGSFLRSTSQSDRLRVCVGRDSRPTGQMLAAAAHAGLASVGCDVIDLGIVTTPSVAIMIEHHNAAGGMAITASHNPIPWNGLKSLNADGVAPPTEHANEIIRRFTERDIDYCAVEHTGAITSDDSTHERHIRRILELLDPAPIRAAGFRVVLDSVNGAGCVAGRMLLEELGCEIIHLNGEPTGYFAHTPEPIEGNLGDLIAQTAAAGAACGFAQDPDADRLAVVDENGRYIGEEYTLVLAARRVLDLDGPSAMATNLSTSRMIDDVAASVPGSVVGRAAVGEANVVEVMKASGATIGGEGNGGVIYPAVCWVRDSLSSMALVLGLMADRQKTLSAIVDALPRYEMIKHKFDLTAIGGRDAVAPALETIAGHFTDARVDLTDGVRADLDDGWVHVRPSNTEPIMRLIAEATTRDRAWALATEVAEAAGLPTP